MPSALFSEEMAFRERRLRHLAMLRLFLGVTYLLIEALDAPDAPGQFRWLAGAAFLVYSILGLLPRFQLYVRSHALSVQYLDLVLMVLLIVFSEASDRVHALLMFYFLITQAALIHSIREVLVVAMVTILFLGSLFSRGDKTGLEFSFEALVFLLVVGSMLAFYFAYQRIRRERRVSASLRHAAGQDETGLVQAAETALGELARWLRCSGAILAAWDEELDYYATLRYPPRRDAGDPPPASFESNPDWSHYRATRLNFFTGDLSDGGQAGNRVEHDFDLHRFIIQEFEIYNCMGYGLYADKKPIGRLLLFNSVSTPRRSHYRELRDASNYFQDVVRHLLTLKRTEIASYESESERIAHNLHDGPLQSMISFEMRLEVIRRLIQRDTTSASNELVSLQQFSRKLVAEMRTFVHRTRGVESDSSSLLAEARRLVEDFQKESGVAVTFVNNETGDIALSAKQSTEMLQVVRESLTNIYKHASATHVLFSVEQKNRQLCVSIQDNGRGFRFGGRYSLDELDAMRMGPHSIKQRVHAMGGSLTLETRPGQGANLRISVPLA